MAIELVKSKEEILENTRTIDGYLLDPEEKNYAQNLIMRGTYYLVIKKGGQLRFYPSRFIGYKKNSRHIHTHNMDKDVLETNKKISEILGRKPEKSAVLEGELVKYCESLGFKATKTGAYGVPRKYWRAEELDEG